MLIAHNPTTFIGGLGNNIFITTPWVMCSKKSHMFIDGVISFHNSKSEKSYLSGRIKEVINLGSIGGTHRVAFVFKKLNKKINPERIKTKYTDTITNRREQVRY
jgi:RNase adaptor protein for sRNA GlmZ degradation